MQALGRYCARTLVVPAAVTPDAKLVPDGFVALPQTQVMSLFASMYGVKARTEPLIAVFDEGWAYAIVITPLANVIPETYLPLSVVLAIVNSPVVGVVAIPVGIVP